jgi:hypothetical protein
MTSFAIKPLPDVLLYGLTDERVISALGAMTHGAGMQLFQAFSSLCASFWTHAGRLTSTT